MKYIRSTFTKGIISFFIIFTQHTILVSQTTSAENNPLRDEVLSAMKRSTIYMVEDVSYQGGYVWSYLEDFSRRWGEMEANETMIWVQPPGTATMGHIFLDAYHATGDEYYYDAAKKAADALIKGQHPSGGWNYIIDLAGEESIKKWYTTIGANGWRLEEFQHYYGNATFDDAGTTEAGALMLRLVLERNEEIYKRALDKVLQFVLESQYAIGGWPQRYPPGDIFSKHGLPDYSSFITFNDDVARRNIEFLIMYYQTLGDSSLIDPIHRGMNAYLKLQMPQRQPGWAMQYSLDLKPAGARSYEPCALSTSTTANNINQLMRFYQLTGNKTYLKRIPEALDWLESLHFPEHLIRRNRTHPNFVEIGTDKTLYLHRRGSNVINGEYYCDYNPDHTISHYGSTRRINVEALRQEYNEILQIPYEELIKESPLKSNKKIPLPQYFISRRMRVSDLNSRDQIDKNEQIEQIIHDLDDKARWITPLWAITHPYIGPGPKEATPGDYRSTRVGDEYDTSAFRNPDTSIKCISTGIYIRNMSLLIDYLK